MEMCVNYQENNNLISAYLSQDSFPRDACQSEISGLPTSTGGLALFPQGWLWAAEAQRAAPTSSGYFH